MSLYFVCPCRTTSEHGDLRESVEVELISPRYVQSEPAGDSKKRVLRHSLSLTDRKLEIRLEPLLYEQEGKFGAQNDANELATQLRKRTTRHALVLNSPSQLNNTE